MAVLNTLKKMFGQETVDPNRLKRIYKLSRSTDSKIKTKIDLLKKGYVRIDNRLVSLYINGNLHGFAFPEVLSFKDDQIYYIWANIRLVEPTTELSNVLDELGIDSTEKSRLVSKFVTNVALKLLAEHGIIRR